MQTCKPVKNPCKICLQTVTKKTGMQCKGACMGWVHFSCLNYTPGRIKDIKDGNICIMCPCPDCKSKVEPNEFESSPAFSCVNMQCPANIPARCEYEECPANFPAPPFDPNALPPARPLRQGPKSLQFKPPPPGQPLIRPQFRNAQMQQGTVPIPPVTKIPQSIQVQDRSPKMAQVPSPPAGLNMQYPKTMYGPSPTQVNQSCSCGGLNQPAKLMQTSPFDMSPNFNYPQNMPNQCNMGNQFNRPNYHNNMQNPIPQHEPFEKCSAKGCQDNIVMLQSPAARGGGQGIKFTAGGGLSKYEGQNNNVNELCTTIGQLTMQINELMSRMKDKQENRKCPIDTPCPLGQNTKPATAPCQCPGHKSANK